MKRSSSKTQASGLYCSKKQHAGAGERGECRGAPFCGSMFSKRFSPTTQHPFDRRKTNLPASAQPSIRPTNASLFLFP